ncbi:MAG: PorT family protein [Bacteroidota bacterium]|nr:PorT family protein [Bacteroidota bacterium]
MITRSFLLGILVLTTVDLIHGQANRFDIGIEGGPSRTFLQGNTLIDDLHEPTLGYSGGLFFQYSFRKVVSLRTKIAFERKGSVLHLPLVDIHGNLIDDVTTNANFNYLTIPLLLRATFGKKVQYFMNAGAYWGYLLKQTFVTKGSKLPETTSDNTALHKRSDMGISAGVGLALPIARDFLLSIEVRHNLGMYNISAVPVINDGVIRTNSTDLLLGFTYKFGQRALPTSE